MVRRQKRSEFVAAGIKQLILDRGLRAGDRLPTEQQMATHFGVSRVSVREATQALSFLGIIDAAPRRGLSVGGVDMDRITQYLGFHVALADYPPRQLWRARFVIEAGALPLVAESMAADATLFESLRSNIEQTRHASGVAQRTEADINFHRALLQASAAGPVVAFNDLLQVFFDRLRDPDPPAGQWSKTVDQHWHLIESLRDGAVDVARHTLRAHFGEYEVRFGD